MGFLTIRGSDGGQFKQRTGGKTGVGCWAFPELLCKYLIKYSMCVKIP
jgi:hypothetical protein